MLKSLTISNFAVIRHLTVDFAQGLNLLTGETGAGKSIIIDALNLLGGARAAGELIRTGERRTTIEALFASDNKAAFRSLLSEVNIEDDEKKLTVRRELHEGGRSRVFINDQLTTLSILKMIAPNLFEIHGQGEQYNLTAARTQLELLDDFAEIDRRESAQAYAEWKTNSHRLDEFASRRAEHNRLRDYLIYQAQEIERIAPRPGEDDELEAEKKMLAHAEKAIALRNESFTELYENDGSIMDRLASVRKRIEDLAVLDGRSAQTLESIAEASVLLAEVADYLRHYGSDVDFSRGRIDEVENRLVELESLKRKYGKKLPQVCELKGEIEAQLKDIENAAEIEQTLRAELSASAARYLELAEALSARRRAVAPELEKRVTDELRAVALERARFAISFLADSADEADDDETSAAKTEVPAHDEKWTPNGFDRVEFCLSANVGEAMRPLARVASGGELSRLMLTLRTICHKKKSEESAPTLLFDEIDAGISGRVAEAVGRRLKNLSRTQQILCVTHQPQLARFADHHFRVTKIIEDGRTVTAINELDGEERVGELARLIGGEEEIKSARAAARWLLETAEGKRQRRAKGKSTEKTLR